RPAGHLHIRYIRDPARCLFRRNYRPRRRAHIRFRQPELFAVTYLLEMPGERNEERIMELYDVLRTTFAAREFTDDPLPDEVLFTILDRARFAPSGGNRQGWRVIVVRDSKTRQVLAELTAPAAKRYAAQLEAGENPWNPIDSTSVDPGTIERTPAPARLTEPLIRAAVVLVVCVDLKVVAATDQFLERVVVVGGASGYRFSWSILLAARH